MSQWRAITGSVEGDFFEQNPELQYVTQIKNLVKEYGKEKAGRIMWSIYMLEDPESPFYGMSEPERRRQIETNYLEEELDWEEQRIESVIESYSDITMPPKKRRLNRLEKAFDSILSQLEEGDANVAPKIKSLQDVLKKADEEWAQEADKLGVSRGREKVNTDFWSRYTK